MFKTINKLKLFGMTFCEEQMFNVEFPWKWYKKHTHPTSVWYCCDL